MSALLKPYLAWLHLHPHWAGLIALIVSFTESFALLGLLIPGAVIMTAIGALIGAEILPFTSIAVFSVIGAIAGDYISFWIGYRFHQRIQALWPFNRYPKLLERGKVFFQRHGGKGVFLGRFIGPMRPVIPLIAGMMKLQPLRFMLVDALSGVLWAPICMLPGILIGAAAQELPVETATRLILCIVAILLIFWCVSWLLKKLYQLLIYSMNYVLAYGWSQLERSSIGRRFKQGLQDPRAPTEHRQLTLSLLGILLLSLFCVLTVNVIQHGALLNWNLPMYHLMRSLRTTRLDQVMVLITFLGENSVLFFAWLAVLGWLVWQRQWRAALHWCVAGIACDAVVDLIKQSVQFPRPLGILQPPAGWSFPSGHATVSVVFYGYLAFLLSYGRDLMYRWIAALTASIIITAIIISRLYLGAHWLTDVVGGVLLGLSIVCFFTINYCRRVSQPLKPLKILCLAALAIAVAWGGYFQKDYLQALTNYTPYWSKYTINTKCWWQQTDQQIPQYRLNRFGKPMQVINLQWAGTLNSITQQLTKQGWHRVSRHNLAVLLGNFLSKDTSKQIPVLAQLYEDRKPVLVMTKYSATQHALVVLRLWDAHLTTETGIPLWVGTVGYHAQWRNYLTRRTLNEQSAEADIEIPATQLLLKDLSNFTWKKVRYQQASAAFKIADKNWDGYVVLIHA